MIVPILISLSLTPVSFLQGSGALMGFKLSNCVLESAAPATPVVSRPTLAAARTEAPAIARTHRRAVIDSPQVVATPPGSEWPHLGTGAPPVARARVRSTARSGHLAVMNALQRLRGN